MTLHERAEQLAGGHIYCEDGWYSCPLAEEGCSNDSVLKDKCNCGRDDRVVAIESTLREVVEECAMAVELRKRPYSTSAMTDDRPNVFYNQQLDDIAAAIRKLA